MTSPTMDPTSFTNLTSTTTINSYLLSLSADSTTDLRVCPEWTAYADAKNKTGYLDTVAPESFSDYEGRITLSKCQKSLVSAGGLALVSSDLESVTGSAMEWRTVAVMRQGATLYVFDAVWDNETAPGIRIAAVVGIANVRKLKVSWVSSSASCLGDEG